MNPLWGCPAAHPNVSSRQAHLDTIEPLGPIGYMIQSINVIGGRVGRDWKIEMPNEVPVAIMDVPFQCLARVVLRRATMARTRAEAGRGERWKELGERDHEIMEQVKKETHG